MSMLEWAKKEVEIASKRERGDKPENERDYGCACYDSALKAYECLCNDGHSGFSFGLTVNILNRLCKGQPLTPIEDIEDVWNEVTCKKDKVISYQCKRMSSLFKDVAEDKSITYHDIDRILCVDVNSGSTYYSGLVRKIVDGMYPIQMPYMPTAPYKVYCEEFLTDKRNGDFDSVGILYLIDPNGERVDIGRYFKEAVSDWEEISYSEWESRRSNRIG